MKNFKKAIAVLLAVLMVAFSVPFTALAQDSYDDVAVLLMVTPYNSATEYGYQSAATAKVLNPEDISFADLGDDHKIAVYILTRGLDDVGTASFGWYYDATVLQNGAFLEQPNTGVTKALVTDAQNASSFDEYMAMPGFSIAEGTSLANYQTSSYAGGDVNGTVWGVFEFTVLEDHANIAYSKDDFMTDYFGFDLEGNCFIDEAYPIGYNEWNSDPVVEFSTGYVYPDVPEPGNDVTYTFINGSSVTQDADADAPANTASTDWTDNGNGTHSRTNYSWVADGDNFKEHGATETANCDSETVLIPAQEYKHTATELVDGKTAVTICSVCGGNQQGGEVTKAEHTYATETIAPTCSAEGYTRYTCTCGATYDADYTAPNPANHVNTTDVAAVAATCIAGGYTAGVWCNDCQQYVSGHTPTDPDTSNHAEGCVLVTDEAVAPRCNADGKTEGSHYSLCGTVNVAQDVIPASADYHDYQITSSTGATCKTPGSVTYTCSYCGDSYTDNGQLDPNNHEGQLVDDPAVDATCVATGLTAGSHWSCCDAVEVAQEDTPIDANNHAGTVALDPSTVVTATCQAGGYTGDTVCSACNNVVTAGTPTDIDPTNHTGQLVDDDAVPATRSTAGLTAGSHWDCCGAIEVAQEVIPALGVNITVDGAGTNVKVNGVDYTDTVNVAYGSKYTLSTDAENFEAWMLGGKIVSTSATYTTAAFADTTYTAVFSAADAVITIVDQFNNVLGTYAAADAASWTAMPELSSACDGYTIAGFDKTLDEIKAATGDVTVTAIYEKAEKTFTVTANGATITVDGVDYQDVATVTGYDVPVTVSADGATAWTVNGKEAGFGASYRFYVTSDVDITFTTAVIDATPVVTAINGNGDIQSDNTKVRFLASRNVPDNYKVVESGYLYGKNIAAADLVLENVGIQPAGAGSKVFTYKNSNTANNGQFAFTFGVGDHSVASARAYLIVSLNGVVQAPIYADAQIYTY